MEVVGLAVGIPSLAGQITAGLLKFKEIADSMREAPTDIQKMMNQMQHLHQVLLEVQAELEAGVLNVVPPPSAQMCLDHCLESANLLNQVVKDLGSEVAKRKKVGSFKWVMKQGQINSLRRGLDTAGWMLMHSRQTIMDVKQNARHEYHCRLAETHSQDLAEVKTTLIQINNRNLTLHTPRSIDMYSDADRILVSRSPKSTGSEFPVEAEYARKRRPVVFKSQQTSKARVGFTPFACFNGRMLEFYWSRGFSSMNINLRYYNIVPDDSPIMRLASKGDLPGVRRLLNNCKASITDVNEWGRTILDNAIYSGNLDLCQFLLISGVDPNVSREKTLWMYYPSHEITERNPDSLFKHPRNREQLARLLTQYVDIDELLDVNSKTILYSGDLETLKWIIGQSSLKEEMQDIIACTRIALRISISRTPFLGEIFDFIFEGKQLTHECCGMRNRSGNTLLHRLLFCLRYCFRKVDIVPQELPEILRAMRNKSQNMSGSPVNRSLHLLDRTISFITTLVSAGSELQEPCHVELRMPDERRDAWRTPLLLLIDQHLFLDYANLRTQSTSSCSPITATSIPYLYTWLDQLKYMGRDLNTYGYEEQKFHLEHDCSPYFQAYILDSYRRCRPPYYSWLRLVSFTYGLEPDDWKFYFIEIMEDWFVQFWDMVEHPEYKMPGAWSVEDNDSDNYLLDYRILPQLYKKEFGREFITCF